MNNPLNTSFFQKVADIILKPGDWICQFFKMKKGVERDFLRLYLNIFLYTKIAVFGAAYFAFRSL